jgi:heme exporter protein C
VITWWKITGILLVLYALIAGLLLPVPDLAILEQSIRNLFYHVPMWFGMIFLLLASMVYSIKNLSSGNMQYDIKA